MNTKNSRSTPPAGVPKEPAPPKKQKKVKKPSKKVPYGRNTVSGLIKALIYLALVVLVSIIAAVFTIAIVNDFLAFNQPEDSPSVIITITEDDDLVSISRMLQDEGIIRFPTVWRVFARIRMRDGEGNMRPFQMGDVTVSAAMNFNSLVSRVMRSPNAREEVRITIPEGWRIDDIIDHFVNTHGMGTREEFVRVINYHEFTHWFMAYIPEWQGDDDPRFYRLEGFLFPDTHDFFVDSTEVHIVNRMLNTFSARFHRGNMQYIANINQRWGLNLNLYDIINLAALIQSEARHARDFPVIGSVFLNRLRSPAASYLRFLQSDATTAYIIRHVEGSMRQVTGADLEYWRNQNHPFCTYSNRDLPPSPINNPGLQAIQAALNAADENGRMRGESGFAPVYYFVTDSRWFAWFARTYQQHQANIARISAGEYREPDDEYHGYD